MRSRVRLPGLMEDQVAASIRRQIAAGKLQPGQCLPSERELSQMLKVSRVTVRNGLAKLVGEGLVRRRPARGYFLRSTSAEPGETQPPALLFLHEENETRYDALYHPALWAAAREEAALHGRLTVVSHMGNRELTAGRAGEFVRIASGILCDHGDRESVSALLAAGLTVVRTGHPRDGLPIDAVVQDNAGGIAQAVTYLHSRGHRRIGHLDPSEGMRSLQPALHAEARRVAFVGECNRMGMGPEPGLLAAVPWTGGEDPGPAERIIRAGATALIVPFQQWQVGARQAMKNGGLALGGPFDLVTWGLAAGVWDDGQTPAHITWSPAQMGRESIRRLLLRMERPDLEPVTLVIPTTLVKETAK
jgi:DNA-binding LacI/PurR family transcriptional regulator